MLQCSNAEEKGNKSAAVIFRERKNYLIMLDFVLNTHTYTQIITSDIKMFIYYCKIAYNLKIKLSNSNLTARLNSFTYANTIVWNAVLNREFYKKNPTSFNNCWNLHTLNSGFRKKQLFSIILLIFFSSLVNFSDIFFNLCKLNYIKILNQ